MSDEQLKRLAELLGWHAFDTPSGDISHICEPNPEHWENTPAVGYAWLNKYADPLTNADLMVRLMVEHEVFVVPLTIKSEVLWGWPQMYRHIKSPDESILFSTPQIAVLHATLAKLEAATDE